MNSRIGKPRNPWVAGVLTFIFPGLGHVYCGDWWKGIKVYPAYWVMVLCGIGFLVWTPLPRVNILLFILIWCATTVYFINDAIHAARRADDPFELRRFNRWYMYILIVLVVGSGQALVNDYLIKKNVFQSYKIPIHSMAPTLLIGDHVTTDKLIYRFKEPSRGDIVVFKYPEDETKNFLKRIIGMPGETIQIKNKTVYINGEPLDDHDYTRRIDPEIFDGIETPRDNYGPVVIPAQSYFVLGDSRDQSLDSRFFGSIKRGKITGKVKVIYFSMPKKWPSEGIRWERIGRLLSRSTQPSKSEPRSMSLGGKP